MKNRFSALCIAAFLCLTTLFFSACANVGQKIVKYCDKGTSAVNQLKSDQAIDQEDADRILPLISDVRKAGVEYDQVEQAVKAARSSTEKNQKREELRAAGRQVIASLNRLNDEGVLKIKNEKTRARVSKYLTFAEVIADLLT